jgi:hypothetical protein
LLEIQKGSTGVQLHQDIYRQHQGRAEDEQSACRDLLDELPRSPAQAIAAGTCGPGHLLSRKICRFSAQFSNSFPLFPSFNATNVPASGPNLPGDRQRLNFHSTFNALGFVHGIRADRDTPREEGFSSDVLDEQYATQNAKRCERFAKCKRSGAMQNRSVEPVGSLTEKYFSIFINRLNFFHLGRRRLAQGLLLSRQTMTGRDR